MTITEMLRFSGSVLGPALVAEALADLLKHSPELQARQPAERPQTESVDRLLRQAFPNGLAGL